MCVCGATNVLADDLLPNKTLRDTIVRILQSNNNSGDNGRIAFQEQVGGILLFCYSSSSRLSSVSNPYHLLRYGVCSMSTT